MMNVGISRGDREALATFRYLCKRFRINSGARPSEVA